MQLPSARLSSRILRSAAIWTGRLLFSTTVPGHTAFIISSPVTTIPGRSTRTPRTSRAREPIEIGINAPASSRPEEAAAIEAETPEPESAGGGERVHACVSHGEHERGRVARAAVRDERSSTAAILEHFKPIQKILSPLYCPDFGNQAPLDTGAQKLPQRIP